MARVRKSTSGCWHWTGGIDPHGYGKWWRREGDRRPGVSAHKFAYEYVNGALPKRGEPGHLQVDHLCHNRSKSCKGGPTCLHRRCVNPGHLAAVTPRENTAASPHATAAVNRRKTECPRGHPFTPENIYGTETRRACRTCVLARTAERDRRLSEERKAQPRAPHYRTLRTHCPRGHPYDGPRGACQECQDAAMARWKQRQQARPREEVVAAALERAKANGGRCRSGHALSGDNVRVTSAGALRCVACHRENGRRRYLVRAAR